MNRRHFLQGLAGIFAAGYAPAVFSYVKALSGRGLAWTCVSLPAVPLVAQKIVVFNNTEKPARVYAGGFVPCDQYKYGRSAEGVYEIGSYETFTFSLPAP